MKKRNFSEFSNITIFDTGLLDYSKKIENSLSQKEIFTLADLFEKDADKTYIPRKSGIGFMIKGALILAKVKYLDTELPINLNPDIRHPYDFWFYTEADFGKIIFHESQIGELRTSIGLPYIGFNWSQLMKIAAPFFDANFSLSDALTDERVIAEIGRLDDQILINRMLVACEYFKRRKLRHGIVASSDDMVALLAEEKRLLQEIARLEEEKRNLTNRLNEIHIQKETLKKRSI